MTTIRRVNLQLAKGDKHILNVVADEAAYGKSLWLSVGVTAIGPEAEDIESVWPVSELAIAADGNGGQLSFDENRTPKVRVISNERLPHQRRADKIRL